MPVMLDQVILHVFNLDGWHHGVLVLTDGLHQSDASRELILQSVLFGQEVPQTDLVELSHVGLILVIQLVASYGLDEILD